MKYVYCVFSPCDDPYSGSDFLVKTFSNRDKAIKFVKEINDEFDKDHGIYARLYYYYFERWEIE